MVFGFGNRTPPPRQAPAVATTTKATPAPGFGSPRTDSVALVTGSAGLCGARLVEMLLERGTATVIAFDLVPPNAVLQQRWDTVQAATGGRIMVCAGPTHGDLTHPAAVEAAFQLVPQIHIVYHIAALVGPFHARDAYFKVNVQGTQCILDNCRKYRVPKLVNSSSPSTRFTGADIRNLTEDELPMPTTKFLQVYAETKAIAERLVAEACQDDDNENTPFFGTVSVAPHQIYGPHDALFLAKILETAGRNRLRIFGKGDNRLSVCYIDNYCHGLLCGADALYPQSPALRQFYIVTDQDPQNFWKMINEACVYMGFTDLNTKFHLPVWFLYIVATVADAVGYCLDRKFKLSRFTLRMMTMDRYFDISRAQRDLHYQPLYTFDEQWPKTLEWFRQYWLPEFQKQQQQQQTQKKPTPMTASVDKKRE